MSARNAVFALALAAALPGCGSGTDCDVRAVTGIFESFKEGCIATAFPDDATKPFRVDTSPSDSKIWVDALNDAYFYFPGNLYLGRRGTCAIGIDLSVDQGERYSCDFRVSGVEKLEKGNQRFDLDIQHSYLAVYGVQGTFTGVIHVTTLPPETAP